ncbi:S1C family serine protease [Streptomyces avidinii]|uniref:S1C family serine protease n=1 Tax=Streptomyces avidinii TaxID=1895 RepID=UPI003865D5CA|nr:S1C family serine protease [Streptomyces avidinii]
MSAHVSLFAASALLISTCGATGATADEPSPGNREQAKAAVVQVMNNSGAGSGFVYDAGSGLIATTATVVAGNGGLEVISEGKLPISAQLLGSDLCQDLAVLKVKPPPTGMKSLQFGDSEPLSNGDVVVSLGYPDAGDLKANAVAVSGAAYEPVGDVTNLSNPDYPSLIHHSVQMKNGTLGGPVLNEAGEVVGINTGGAVKEKSLGEERIAAEAISSNHARSVLPALAAGSMKNDPGWWLGAVSDPGLTVRFATAGIDKTSLQKTQKRLQNAGTDGLFVFDVRNGSAAQKARIQQGAVITAVNGEAVSSFPELCDVLEPAEPGAKLSVEGIHSGAGRDSGHRFGDPWTADVVLAGK